MTTPIEFLLRKVSPLPKGEGTRANARRGVLLLVILAMLAMFGLLGIAFVVLTSQARRGAEALRRVDQYADPAPELLNQAFMQIARGTNNTNSVLGPHSLLEDIYGRDTPTSSTNPGIMAAGTDAQPICNGQLIEFTVSIANPSNRLGCVLTMLDGPAAGRSTRIVGYDSINNRFQIVAFDDISTSSLLTYLNSDPPNSTCSYHINGTPFSGTGFNGGTGIDALKPNDLAGKTGANEDYDAVDFQNMLLAMIVPGEDLDGDGHLDVDEDANGNGILDPGEDTDGDGHLDVNEDRNGNGVLDPDRVPIPSLHRPALVNYHGGALPKRQYILRPLAEDHFEDTDDDGVYDTGEPGFTGSNPNFVPGWDGVTGGGGAWDVDNDGDGVADSIWVDLGMPARSTPDGLRYKPLFAILCTDLDGRLNLNAHGCVAQTDDTDSDADGTADYYGKVNVGGGFVLGGQPDPLPTLPRGQGYGPAEINLLPLVGNLADYQALLDSRYVVQSEPGATGNDPLSHNKLFDYPNDYSVFTNLTSYGTPPDLKGSLAIGLDLRGQPLYPILTGWANAADDDPYELNLSRNNPTSADAPFTPAELERLLRGSDIDGQTLPDRLATLTSLLASRRHEITTESWDLPCPNLADPSVTHISDLLANKNVPQSAWPDLLPPEMLSGLRMDINRPFGNGRDDDGTNVVDEPGERLVLASLDPKQIEWLNPAGAANPVPFDHDNDGVPVDTNGNGTIDPVEDIVEHDPTLGDPRFDPYGTYRQLHARHLYVLMMLLMDKDYMHPEWVDANGKARAIAQWAVNVVDFRDRDSIMTRFDYDPDPFDASGWNPPGDAAHRVWGCERPELLITETLAFHDRRTKDLETPNGLTTDPAPGETDATNDFDQPWKPQGSLFVELYNPWTALEPRAGELYETTYGGVDLTKADGSSPCWRLIVVDGGDCGKDPDDPDPTQWPTFERSVYFVDSTVTLPTDDSSNVKFQPEDAQVSKIAPILPGRYMVIGPGKPGDTDTSTTYIGFETPDKNPGAPGSSRRIELKPDNNPATTGQVAVKSDGTNDDLSGVTIQNAVAVVVNSPRRLSISEPDGGYTDVDASSAPYDPVTGYTAPHDEPLDTGKPLEDAIKTSGRTDDVKVVHLQRLANPLLPYDADVNPYRTIDSMSIDLTSFNGLTNGPDLEDSGSEVNLLTRERGEHNDTAGNANNLWAHEPYGNSPSANTNNVPATVTNHYFNESLHHTLGYLNDHFGLPRNTTGYVGDPPDATGPFPWLTWNNRPFVSQLELTLVPAVRSSKLLQTYGMTPAISEPYAPSVPANVPFPHLLNFFQSDADAGDSPQFHRVLEYLRVPSRFVGTELQGNPSVFVGGTNHVFHPPFNLISRYRDPGRVNINTVFSHNVWLGLMNYFPGMSNGDPASDTTWQRFVSSRRGYAGADMWSLDAPIPPTPPLPTRFANPFRSSVGASLVPLSDLERRGVNVTLLRAQGIDPDTATTPLFANTSANPYNNASRNPYFRYEGLQRLGNLVTTRSNVYAIWITVGYFEVEACGVDAAHPDGYALGRELGTDTGEIERHRAFYIFDRSIPVGFERGKDHNVEKAVLLKRFIE